MENLSKLRVEIRSLQKQRFKIELSLLRPLPMVDYSLITAYFPCGKSNCRCKKGKRYFHGPYYYLSQHRFGKTKNIYIKQKDLGRISILAGRYKEYESSLTKIRRINQKILSLLKKIEEGSFVSEDKIAQYGKTSNK
ncbi:MAG: hypothetical protein NC822_07315 [Candidatus Omnitrophica bacterium]|nr:hypothetical protein [Candidatus Omnitrophota bacterium]